MLLYTFFTGSCGAGASFGPTRPAPLPWPAPPQSSSPALGPPFGIFLPMDRPSPLDLLHFDISRRRPRAGPASTRFMTRTELSGLFTPFRLISSCRGEFSPARGGSPLYASRATARVRQILGIRKERLRVVYPGVAPRFHPPAPGDRRLSGAGVRYPLPSLRRRYRTAQNLPLLIGPLPLRARRTGTRLVLADGRAPPRSRPSPASGEREVAGPLPRRGHSIAVRRGGRAYPSLWEGFDCDSGSDDLRGARPNLRRCLPSGGPEAGLALPQDRGLAGRSTLAEGGARSRPCARGLPVLLFTWPGSLAFSIYREVFRADFGGRGDATLGQGDRDPAGVQIGRQRSRRR